MRPPKRSVSASAIGPAQRFESRGTLLRAFYYTAIVEDQESSSVRPLVDWLDYNGYTVITKPTKVVDANGPRKVRGNMDIELAVDAMELAEHIDQIVLFSGEGDFRSLVKRAAAGCPRHLGFDDCHSAADGCRRSRRQADVFCRSGGAAVLDRPRSRRACSPRPRIEH